MTELTPGQWAWRPMTRYLQLSGRAPRAEYWWFIAATTVLSFAFDLVDKLAGETGYIAAAFSLITLISSITVGVRRLHDIDRSGWWMGVTMGLVVVFFGILVALGEDPFGGLSASGGTTVFMVLGMIAMGILFVTLFVFSLIEGTEGPNSYGPDPYGPDRLEEVFA